MNCLRFAHPAEAIGGRDRLLVDWPNTNPTLYSLGNNCGIINSCNNGSNIHSSNNGDTRHSSIICNGISDDDTRVRNTSVKYSNDNRSNEGNHYIGSTNSCSRNDYNLNISSISIKLAIVHISFVSISNRNNSKSSSDGMISSVFKHAAELFFRKRGIAGFFWRKQSNARRCF